MAMSISTSCGLWLLASFDGLGAAFGCNDSEAAAFEQRAGQLAVEVVIIDHQHCAARAMGGGSALRQAADGLDHLDGGDVALARAGRHVTLETFALLGRQVERGQHQHRNRSRREGLWRSVRAIESEAEQ